MFELVSLEVLVESGVDVVFCLDWRGTPLAELVYLFHNKRIYNSLVIRMNILPL